MYCTLPLTIVQIVIQTTHYSIWKVTFPILASKRRAYQTLCTEGDQYFEYKKLGAYRCLWKGVGPYPQHHTSLQLHDTIYTKQFYIFGFRKKKPQDWFQGNMDTISPALHPKRSARLTTYLDSSTTDNVAKLKYSLAAVQHITNEAQKILLGWNMPLSSKCFPCFIWQYDWRI